ncbi:MAG: response regulator [Deltaproteobacteria bacterium]|nr:response regulator [Deltaproteobacteria bacterium]
MPRKILVVEDVENNRILIRDLLAYYGYTVVEAKNGSECVELAKEERPDLILMDLQMPVMDGFTAVKILKNDPGTRDIKIFGITSSAMKGDREKVMDAGFDGYISKPIDTRQLPRIVKMLLR